MGSGRSGLYSGTHGSRAVPGSTDYMQHDDLFSINIRKRKDIDVNEFYDVIAHGTTNTIQLYHAGIKIEIDHRIAARLLNSNLLARGKSLRLFSCDTGSDPHGFAQNLANKLNIIVEAPTKLVWAYPNGKYVVAARRKDDPNQPDLNDRGRFIKFYPGGKKK